MSKKCLLYGNCQTIALRSLLSRHPNFSEKYDILEVKPVHLLKEADVSSILELVQSADLFIYHIISHNYRGLPQLSTDYLLSKVKPTCQTLSLPVAYFTGYHPEITYLKDAANHIVDEPFPYHDLNILKLYSQGKTAEEIIACIESDRFYEISLIQANLDNTLNNLSNREAHIDIKLSPFIRENFRIHKLFHTFNHPSGLVIEFIIDSILNAVGISSEGRMSEFVKNIDVLGRFSFPLYPSTAEALNIEFEVSSLYKIKQEMYTRKSIVGCFCDFYDQNSDRVQAFLEHTSPRS